MCLNYNDLHQDEQEDLDESFINLFKKFVNANVGVSGIDLNKLSKEGLEEFQEQMKVDFSFIVTDKLAELNDFLFEEVSEELKTSQIERGNDRR